MAALDLVIKARSECRNSRKIAKFWKSYALKAGGMGSQDAPLTPSPSDVSDTGLRDKLSPERVEKLKELMKSRGKRNGISDDCRSVTSSTSIRSLVRSSKEVDGRRLDMPLKCELAPISVDDNLATDGSASRNDNTLLEDLSYGKTLVMDDSPLLPEEIAVLSDRQDKPAGNSKASIDDSAGPTEVTTETPIRTVHASAKSSQKVSRPPLSSVQNKRNIFEALAKASNSPTSSPHAKKGSSMLPVSSTRKRSDSVGRRAIRKPTIADKGLSSPAMRPPLVGSKSALAHSPSPLVPKGVRQSPVVHSTPLNANKSLNGKRR